MAKQLSDIIVSGNIDNLVFYAMEGKGYVRRKSSLTGKQFKTKSCFDKSRKSAERFGNGNKMAAEVYQSLRPGNRNYPLYCLLKTTAIALLKQEASPEQVKAALRKTATASAGTNRLHKVSQP